MQNIRDPEVIKLLKELERRKEEEPLRYYQPMHPQLVDAHCSNKSIIFVTGGKQSGKSEWMAVEFVIRLCGWVPDSLKSVYPMEKLRDRIDARLVVSDFQHGWFDVDEPKFKHWIPRRCLIDQSWDKSWSKEYRRLKVYNAYHWWSSGDFRSMANISTLSIMSCDQEEERHRGANFDLIGFDEQPPEPVWEENLPRIVKRKGQILLAMTPDPHRGDPTWVYNRVYEPGTLGNPNIDVFTIFTEDNKSLDSETLEIIKGQLDPEKLEVSLHGGFLHMLGLVYKEFRATPHPETGLCHVVEPFDIPKQWPRVMVIDPHPRAPWAVIWVAVDEGDDWWVYDYLWEEGKTIEDLAHIFIAKEREHGREPSLRISDPYAGNQDNLDARDNSIERRLARFGMRLKLSCNDPDIRGNALRAALQQSVVTGRGRLNVFRTMHEPIHQMTHFIWKEWKTPPAGRDMRQERSERNSHFVADFEYLAVENPTFFGLQNMGKVIKWTG